MDHYNYIIHLDLVRNNKLFYIRREKMSKILIEIYERYLDRIWGDLSKDDKIRLEGHFNGLINELGDYREEYCKEKGNE